VLPLVSRAAIAPKVELLLALATKVVPTEAALISTVTV
jgi:hypothetical protein